MIVDKINQYLCDKELALDTALKYEIEKLAGWSFERKFTQQEEKDSKGRIYLSQIGRCPRQLAYQFHGFEKKGNELNGRAFFNFWFGDLIELAMTSLTKLALKKFGGGQIIATGFDQLRVNLKIDDFIINGYPDGLFWNSEDRELINIEAKSMPSHSYKRFEKGEIDESYILQVHGEMKSLGLKRTCMICINKNNGVFGERIIQFNDSTYSKIVSNIRSVLKSTPTALPGSAFKANDKGIYPWQCLYCAYWGHCRNAEKVVSGKSYILKEKQNA